MIDIFKINGTEALHWCRTALYGVK